MMGSVVVCAAWGPLPKLAEVLDAEPNPQHGCANLGEKDMGWGVCHHQAISLLPPNIFEAAIRKVEVMPIPYYGKRTAFDDAFGGHENLLLNS